LQAFTEFDNTPHKKNEIHNTRSAQNSKTYISQPVPITPNAHEIIIYSSL